MTTYKRHRFPPDIISYAVWLHHRFNLSHRDIEDLLAERGIVVTRESICLWLIKFWTLYGRRLKRKHRGYGDTFYIDEVFVKLNGQQHYLCRAVDLDGEVVGVYLQVKRDAAAAKRFFKRLLRSHGSETRKIVPDKLRSYGSAHRELMPDVFHSTKQYENNRAEQSHEATSVRERGMRKFKSMNQAQRFLGAHAAAQNLFNLARHLVRAEHYRKLRVTAFVDWERAIS
jgi:putative transposase